MTLLEELKERHDKLWKELDEAREREEALEQQISDFEKAIAGIDPKFWERELDTKIAALEPPPAAVTEPEIPEGFTKWNGGGFTEALHCKDVEVMFRDGRVLQGVSGAFTWSTAAELLANGWKHEDAEGGKIDAADDIIAYRIIDASVQSEPFVSLAAETEMPSVPGAGEESRDQLCSVEGCEIHADDASEFAEEGYAPVIDPEPATLIDAQTCEPVLAYPQPETLADPIWNEPEPTKPEADAIAKAVDYYDPKAVAERNRFDPFRMFRRETEDA